MTRLPIFALVAACGGTAIPGDIEHRLLIREVVAQPPEPCAGDDVRVSVITTVDEPRLVTLIDGENGKFVLRTFETAGTYELPAHVSIPGEAADARMLSLKVRDCGPRPRLEVAHRFVTGRPDALVVEIVGQKNFGTPVHVRWDFGDGTSRAGDRLAVEKSYALRPQSGDLATYEVVVVAEDADGRIATRRISVSLTNHAAALKGGAHWLPADADRFAQRVPEGRRAVVRLKNVLAEKVTYDSLRVTALRCDGAPGEETTWSLGDGFASPPKALVAGQIWSGWLILRETMAPENACRTRIRVSGSTEAGTPVISEAVIELSPPAGSIVDDAAMIEDVRRAQAILGRRQVTAEEVERLRAR